MAKTRMENNKARKMEHRAKTHVETEKKKNCIMKNSTININNWGYKLGF